MPKTAKGILENMLYLVKKLGFFPNGNRIYYINRSQPPLLIRMMNAYYNATGDEAFLFESLPVSWSRNHDKYDHNECLGYQEMLIIFMHFVKRFSAIGDRISMVDEKSPGKCEQRRRRI